MGLFDGILGGGGNPLGGLFGGGGGGGKKKQPVATTTQTPVKTDTDMASGGGFGIGIDVLGLDAAEFYKTYSENERFEEDKNIRKKQLDLATRTQSFQELLAAANLIQGQQAIKSAVAASPLVETTETPNASANPDDKLLIGALVVGGALLLLLTLD